MWEKKYSKWYSRRSKTWKINLSTWETRNSKRGIKIFRKWIKEDYNEEFKNYDEEILKFRKRSSHKKIKKE